RSRDPPVLRDAPRKLCGARCDVDRRPDGGGPAGGGIAREASCVKGRLLTALAATVIFCVNVWLNWPLFLPGELPFRGSVEGGYASMARFISMHPNPWGWNPFQYCGVPTQFLYVPGLPYLTALFVRVVPSLAPDYAFR